MQFKFLRQFRGEKKKFFKKTSCVTNLTLFTKLCTKGKAMIELEGRVWKDSDSSWWLVEISFLDVMTQGRTRKEALKMIKDAVMELLKDSYENFLGKQFQLTVNLYQEGVIGLGASDEKLLFALGLKRQRLRSGSTIRDVSKRLKSKSPNAYARYERAQSRPSLEKYAELLHVANPQRRPLLVS
jgi:predicted RNase H-like HicB family nuclease